MIDRLTWLHISDLHFVAGGMDEFSQQVASQALLDDVQDRADPEDPVKFVLVTGDIAYSGRSPEYERAATFLMDLAVRDKDVVQGLA